MWMHAETMYQRALAGCERLEMDVGGAQDEASRSNPVNESSNCSRSDLHCNHPAEESLFWITTNGKIGLTSLHQKARAETVETEGQTC
jgi:hypothetical protein